MTAPTKPAKPKTRRATELAVGRALAAAGLEGVVEVSPSDAGRFEAMVSDASPSAAAELRARLPWASVDELSGLIFVT